MASRRAIEAKNERTLRQILKEDGNRHCVDCGGFGPQYVVCKFSVFVCSSCSGVHRLFGHRVKGVSLCTFTGDEIALLQRGGNEVFRKTFCATMPHDVMRPVESNTESIKRWIEDVYVSKKYYKDVAASKRPPPLDTSESSDIAVIPLADVLGSDTPILRISMEVGEKTYTDTGATTTKETKSNDIKEEKIKEEVEPATILHDNQQHHVGDEWDPFGVSSASPSIDQSDTLFLEEEEVLQPSEKPAVSVENTAEKEDDISFDVEWEAFAMEQLSSPAPPDDTPAPSPTALDAYSNEDSITTPEEELAKLDISHHHIGAVNEQREEEPTRSNMGAANEQREEEPTGSNMDAATPARPEVPLDAFYPEFSKIRETGILPTGAPVPWHMRPQQTMPPVVTHHAPPRPESREQTVIAPPREQTVIAPPREQTVIAPPREQTVIAPPAMHPEPSRASRQAAPTYDKATKTLFGTEKNLTAYDLSAQHAPKPNMTGNPFA